jgi:hypothetical protein
VPVATRFPSSVKVKMSLNAGTPDSAGGVTVVSHVPVKIDAFLALTSAD